MPAAGASTGRGSTGRASRIGCRPYDGPPLPMLVAACKAPDGSYWTIQAWQRRAALPRLRPLAAAPHELGAPRRPLVEAAARARGSSELDVRRHGGRASSAATATWGTGARVRAPTPKGVPKDMYGRNLYIDTLNSAYGPGWKREARDPDAQRHRNVLPQLRPAAAVRRAIRARTRGPPRRASATGSRSVGRE